MLVEALKVAAGANFNFVPGDRFEVSRSEGELLIADRAVAPVQGDELQLHTKSKSRKKSSNEDDTTQGD